MPKTTIQEKEVVVIEPIRRAPSWETIQRWRKHIEGTKKKLESGGNSE